MSLLGIPSADQIKALADGAIDRAQAAGVTLEDHGKEVLSQEIAAIFAGLKQAEDPILDEAHTANGTLSIIADTIAQFKGGCDIHIQIVPKVAQ